MQKKYETEIQARTLNFERYNKTSNHLSTFRLFWALVIAYTLFTTWTQITPVHLIILAAEIFIFAAAYFYHEKIREKMNREQGLIQIAHQNLHRLLGTWSDFPDTGEELIDHAHNYSADLDIVGNRSLFQFLNSTHTYYGRQALADDLLNPHFSKEEIKRRQEAISELSAHYELSSNLEYTLSKIGVDPAFKTLIDALGDGKSFLQNKALTYLLSAMRLLTTSTLLVALLTQNASAIKAAVLLLAIQSLIWMLTSSKTKSYLAVIQPLSNKMPKYSTAFNEITNQSFHTEELKAAQSTLAAAKPGIQKLAAISTRIDQCKNGIFCLFVNILWLWDLKNAVSLDAWKETYAFEAASWFSTLGTFESLMSFSNIPRNTTTTCLPEICETSGTIHAKQLGHPLIQNATRVCNDLTFENDIIIISGSNMSGKTTFMRTVGVNLVLARAGSFVCAEKLTCSQMSVMTSMRIADNLTEGISTFYAELKRIKAIIDASKATPNQLFLIDEIFRGTNSVDRLKGAEGVLKNLYDAGASGMITTHDLEVCKLTEQYPRMINYNFQEHYTEDEILFDYKMREGISKTTNATYLLKKVGIL